VLPFFLRANPIEVHVRDWNPNGFLFDFMTPFGFMSNAGPGFPLVVPPASFVVLLVSPFLQSPVRHRIGPEFSK
jgi:hypothetical protein